MRKEQRIKKNEEFSAVFNHGRSVANRQFVLYVLQKEEQEQFRLGLSVSKKVGNAVVRNRIKRLIRTVFQEKQEILLPHCDYVVIARKPTATMDYYEFHASLAHVMKKAGVSRRSSEHASKKD
ncbi:ribonuclease P protein component [Alkalicoccobacillus gibsonii]|jgi:ribonuclease P protein component|uniref:ribonuclease P protein component n=1 Tax=Alkalicoccobacillus gibsonii TaxID=79881 RepID=UPI0019338891|nr:ribonuclease P protein component [Alkalicoccobacillus gibsonii]MBM0065390.1 ribonuclease P protein component [Alkalicoccobacillus gibsonii]